MDKGVVYIRNGILLSLKKNEILPFATTWMNLRVLCLIKMSDRIREILCVFTLMWNLKNKTNEYYKRERDS